LRRYTIGKTGSIALIERLWRTLKEALRLAAIKPAHRVDLERRVHQGLVYFAHFRPHQGLAGATPAELYLGLTPLHHSALHPPRARPGEAVPDTPPFEIAYLDRERTLPFLRRKAA
jgi:hypothetical protein